MNQVRTLNSLLKFAFSAFAIVAFSIAQPVDAGAQAARSHEDTPQTSMKIGIIGAGNIGATLARKLAASGHDIKLANSKGPEAIRDLADESGATAVTKEVAVRDVAAVILSIPFANYAELAGLFTGVPAGVVVIDTSNYYPFRDGAIAAVDRGEPESVWVSKQIGRPLVKAWNAVLAETLASKGLTNGSPDRIAVPVAGDGAESKVVAMALVEVDAGHLANSWRQQPGTPAYCTELTPHVLEAALVSAVRSKAPLNRDRLMKQFMESDHELSHAEIVALNRAGTSA